MKRNAMRLLAMINQLLELAKIDAGAGSLDRKAVVPSTLLHRVADAFQPAALRRGVEVSVVPPANDNPVVLDPDRIEGALTNLVANALRFTPSGGHVVLRLRDLGGEIAFAVEDDGSGIPADELPKLFERFAQAGSSSEKRGGTGLGLALVRETARLHGGDVTAESEPGKRTVFELRIPRVVVTDAAVADDPSERRIDLGEELPTKRSTEEFMRAGPSRAAPLALVAEDNPDLRALLADVLAARYRVHAVADAEKALELAPELKPDVVVSDIAMPGMTGIELTRALRALEETRTTPIILVTARGDVQTVLEGFDAGADDYLTKPFHGRELLARVEVHLRVRQVLKQLAHQERLAALGVVAASVAHNVRNALIPLTSGLPAVRDRVSAAFDEPTREMWEIMESSAERIEQLSTDLLDLSRIDRSTLGRFEPGKGLAASVRLVSAKLPSSVQVTTEVDESVTMFGRPGDLNHVFLNLIDNAARAVGEKGKIRVRGRRENGVYIIDVSDSGAGVDPEIAEKIFEPFVTTRGVGEGTGLGLAIARDVVEQHRGKIEVGPSDLGGASFTIRLPLNNEPTVDATS
jgi:signal transduction histidine kinase